jgi:hypothetical protein
MAPVVRRRVDRIDADRLDLIDRVQNAADVQPADAKQDFAAWRTKGSVKYGSPGATAGRMSTREMIVPKSFEAQRPNAKTCPGAKLTIRVLRVRTRSSAIRRGHAKGRCSRAYAGAARGAVGLLAG